RADRERGRGLLQPGQRGAVRRGKLFRQRGFEDGHRLAELHRAALELPEDAEDLLSGALLDLGGDQLSRAAAQPLAETERRAAGEAEGKRRELRSSSDRAARDFAHRDILTAKARQQAAVRRIA